MFRPRVVVVGDLALLEPKVVLSLGCFSLLGMNKHFKMVWSAVQLFTGAVGKERVS